MDYVVEPGDTLYGIARRFGVPLDELIRANPQIADPSLIYPGDVVHVPMRDARAGWCCLVMAPRHPVVHAPSVALVHRVETGHVVIGLHDMPEPGSVSPGASAYRGWLLSAQGAVRAEIPLYQAQRIFWIGHRDVFRPEPSDRVAVTAERPYSHVPAGPVIYDQPLTRCCS
jgi:spore coat assembly protein SafA